MFEADVRFINEVFDADCISPHQLDRLLADGWRHFGTRFFRYNWAFYELDIRRVIPLRIRLSDFRLSKSQRRVLRKNEDLALEIRPISITSETEALFDRHKRRFRQSMPDSIYDFVSHQPATVPCEAREIAVCNSEGEIIAVSYFDIGARCTSGVYAMFEPSESSRRLGILTMLKEIEHSIAAGKEFYYQGYSYEGQSFYDYKKQFAGTEGFDWKGSWSPLTADAQ